MVITFGPTSSGTDVSIRVGVRALHDGHGVSWSSYNVAVTVTDVTSWTAVKA